MKGGEVPGYKEGVHISGGPGEKIKKMVFVLSFQEGGGKRSTQKRDTSFGEGIKGRQKHPPTQAGLWVQKILQ